MTISNIETNNFPSTLNWGFMGLQGGEQEKAGKALIRKYKRSFKRPPEWSFPSKKWSYKDYPLLKPFPPTIPFIGKSYFSQKTKIALYASAENLSHYERRPETTPFFLGNDSAWNRHHAANLEGWDKFFPRVHIGPVEDGSLLCAVLFICDRLGLEYPKDPGLFLENLVVGNVGKYSISGNTNKDYARSIKMLKPSVPYFQIDLEILQPEILVLPQTIYTHKIVKTLISRVLPKATIIPVPQFNSTVVNIHLKKNKEVGSQLAKKWQETILDEWTNHLTGYAKGFPYRYFAELETVLQKKEIKKNKSTA